ncbi:MAG: PAS domain S-box protein [Chitinophagaceae bacterium]|nr:PAS domain S-box protein [Chitinophagaceae bacterium]
MTTENQKTTRETICPTLQSVLGSTDKLDDIYNNIDDVIWAAAFNPYRCLYLNRACEKVFGYTIADILSDGSLFANSIHPDDSQKFYESVATAYVSGKSACEFRIVRPDGNTRLLKGQAILVKGEDGREDILTGIVSDITDLNTATKALSDKEAELADIVNNINDSFFTIDNAGTVTYVNTALEELLEVKREDVLGKNAWELFPAAKDTNLYSFFNDNVKKGEATAFEDYYVPLEKWFKVNVYPRPEGLSVFCADITDEKKAREDVQTAKRNLRAIIDTTDDLIWSVDRQMNIIESNEAYRRVVSHRYGNRSTEGMNVFDNIPEEKRKEWKGYFDRALSGETYTIKHESFIEGKPYCARVTFNPIRDEQGKVIGISCFSSDITQQCMQMKEIEQKNKLLTDIAYMQSHQVRGPMASIIGLASLFNADDPSDPVNKEILEGFIDAAQKLNDVISEIDTKTKISYEQTIQYKKVMQEMGTFQ